jgi:serine protease Do
MMTNDHTDHPLRSKIFSRHRLVLFASVASIGAVVALGGAMGYPQSLPAWTSSARAADAQRPLQGFADLVAKVKPAVISVRVQMDENASPTGLSSDGEGASPFQQGSSFEKFFRQHGGDGAPGGAAPSHQMIIGAGSGFFISPDGYAVTNNHVVDHAKTVEITTDDGTVYPAKVIGTDAKTDLALIKVDGKASFTYVSFEDQVPRVGDWVVAVGNPFGLGGTVTNQQRQFRRPCIRHGGQCHRRQHRDLLALRWLGRHRLRYSRADSEDGGRPVERQRRGDARMARGPGSAGHDRHCREPRYEEGRRGDG